MGSDITIEILAQIRDGITSMNERLDTTNERLDTTNERLEGTNGRLATGSTGWSKGCSTLVSSCGRSPSIRPGTSDFTPITSTCSRRTSAI